MITVGLTFKVSGDTEMYERLEKAHSNLRPFLKRVSVFGMGQAQRRLLARMSPDEDAVSSGRLVNSLTIGGPHSISQISEKRAEWGSNLEYAAQVNEGGPIEPKTAKALAIPLTPKLKRSGLWPRNLDPTRTLLRFVPYRGAKANVFGLLVDEGKPLEGRQKRVRGRTAYGPGPLYALAYRVRQEGKHFLELDEEDLKEITGAMWSEHLGLG